MSEFKRIPLRKLLKRRKDQIRVIDSQEYTRLTIRTNGGGIEIRDKLLGLHIRTKNQFLVNSGQFVLSKIDARNGAFGVLPAECDGAIITGNFWAFDADESKINIDYLNYFSKTPTFISYCVNASEGTTNRRYLRENLFLNQTIPLPSLEEQARIVSHIDSIVNQLHEAHTLRESVDKELYHLLYSLYLELIDDVQWLPMSDVAPIVRRVVDIDDFELYPELGIRSFGNGTFHKEPISGFDLGSKRIYWIKTDDLLFSNVFAWEGAIAIAQKEDNNRVGSHRYITCVPHNDIATSEFLCFHFLTPQGLHDIGEASPGGAGRNRTLGLKKLEAIEVPIPSIEKQQWFSDLLAITKTIQNKQKPVAKELEAFLPSLLHNIFQGEL